MTTIIKQSIIIGCCWGVLLGFFAFAVCAEDVPSAVREAAERGLPSFLRAIPARDLAHFNFSDLTELEQATLGEPFLIYTIPPDVLLKYQADTPLDEMISPTSVWCFPVLYNGESRTLLMVDFLDGAWKAVGIGRSGTAKQWAAVRSTLSSSESDPPRFVKIFQATADFVVVSSIKADSQMIPLESARISLGLDKAGKAYTPSELLPVLQQAVRKNLESSSAPFPSSE